MTFQIWKMRIQIQKMIFRVRSVAPRIQKVSIWMRKMTFRIWNVGLRIQKPPSRIRTITSRIQKMALRTWKMTFQNRGTAFWIWKMIIQNRGAAPGIRRMKFHLRKIIFQRPAMLSLLLALSFWAARGDVAGPPDGGEFRRRDSYGVTASRSSCRSGFINTPCCL